MEKAKKNILNFSNGFSFLFLITLVVFSGNEAIANKGVVIPFINISQTYLILGIIMMGFLYLVYKGRIILDQISFILLLRVVLSAVPPLFLEVSSTYLGNFVESTFPFFIYTFLLNSELDIKLHSKTFIIFAVVIALQCVLAYIVIVEKGFATYNSLIYKDYFVIPVGATNNISAVIVPLLILGDQTILKNFFRRAYCILLLIAVFLCKSRTGMVICVLYLFSKLFLRENGRYSNTKKVILCLMPVIIGVGFAVISSLPIGEKIKNLLFGYSQQNASLDALTSGRLSLFIKSFVLACEHPIIGNGFTYERLDNLRTHNAFLQMFYENGILGLLIFIMFLVIVFKRIKFAKNINKFYYAFCVAVPFILINAMIEETITCSFMLIFGLTYIAGIKKEEINWRNNKCLKEKLY